MTLTSMTAFVLQQNYTTTLDMSQIDFYDKELNILSKIRAYAKFLSRPLELWMFVPCDYEGNIWEYPPTQEEWDWATKDSADAEWSFKQKEFFFTKAKERVLFEGFEVKKNIYDESGQSLFIGWESYNPAIFLKLQGEDWELDDFKTIEDLLSFSQEITLTPTAIKEINL